MMNTSPFNPGRVDMAVVKDFTTTLFAGWDWARRGGTIALRGIGEKGTDKDGRFREPKFVDPRSVFGFSQIETHLKRWGDNGVAAFILPGIVADAAAEDGHATDERIRAFTAIALDIDSGNVAEKLDHCRDWIGEPTMLVHSGGVTDLGHNKVHAYWCLTEPTEKVKDIGRIRKILAAKVGGDQSFGRPAQVIRIAGSIYGKGGVCKPVELVSKSGPRYDLADLVEAIEGMEWMEGCLPPMELPVMSAGGMMDFSAGAGVDLNRDGMRKVLMHDVVHEGAVDGVNRWEAFNSKAGRFIKMARDGLMTIEEAYEVAKAVMEKFTQPEWTPARFDSEWQGLLNKDVREKGEIDAAPVENMGLPVTPPEAKTKGIETIETVEDLLGWAVERRSSLHPPARIDLVKDMIVAGQRHLLVSEGGAGKTFLCMDLALKLAAAKPDRAPLQWLGQPITDEAYDGVVIMFTAEDNQDALDRRWKQIDPDMTLRKLAGDRLIVIPMDNIGGSFPLVMNKPHTGHAMATPAWANFVRLMQDLAARGRRIRCVIIDTLNSTLHGEESSAEVIAEYMRALAPITGDLGAALIITHHIRKMQNDRKVSDGDAMLEAIRGSAAIKDNVRVAIGIWRAPDYKRRLRMMGLPERDKSLYCAELVKANEPLYRGTKYLLRQESGLLEDCTSALARCIDVIAIQRRAWAIFAIGHYAEQGMFFCNTGNNGVWKQRGKLHPMLLEMKQSEYEAYFEQLVIDGFLIKREVGKKGGTDTWYDLPENRGIDRLKKEDGTAVETIKWADYEIGPDGASIEKRYS